MNSTESRESDSKVNEIFQFYENINSTCLYNSLIDRILEYPSLVKWIENKTKDKTNINLINKDWIPILKNNLIFQEHINSNVKYSKYDSISNKAISNYRIQDYSNNLNVLAVGTFKLIEDEAMKLKLVNCSPLQCIAEIMCLDLQKIVLPNAKFYIQNCRALCKICRDNNSNDTKWCLQKGMVFFDGAIRKASRKYCQEIFQEEVKAIVNLEINMAYTFGDKCKIGGNIKSLIFIEEIFSYNDENDIAEGFLKLEDDFTPNDNKSDLKRKNEDEVEESKRLKQDVILGIPKGINYENPKQKQFEVKTFVESMPEI